MLVDELTDVERQQVLNNIADPPRGPAWKLINGLVYVGSRLFVPECLRKRIVFTVHDQETLHGGIRKTTDAVQAKFYWPKVGTDVRSWIRTCDVCQRKERPFSTGFLSSLEIPKRRFTDYSMDFFDTPLIRGKDQVVLVIID